MYCSALQQALPPLSPFLFCRYASFSPPTVVQAHLCTYCSAPAISASSLSLSGFLLSPRKKTFFVGSVSSMYCTVTTVHTLLYQLSFSSLRKRALFLQERDGKMSVTMRSYMSIRNANALSCFQSWLAFHRAHLAHSLNLRSCEVLAPLLGATLWYLNHSQSTVQYLNECL